MNLCSLVRRTCLKLLMSRLLIIQGQQLSATLWSSSIRFVSKTSLSSPPGGEAQELRESGNYVPRLLIKLHSVTLEGTAEETSFSLQGTVEETSSSRHAHLPHLIMGDFSDRTATEGDNGVILSVVPRREGVGRDDLSTVDSDKEEDDERTAERIHLQSLNNCHVPDDGGDSPASRPKPTDPHPDPPKRLCAPLCCRESDLSTGGSAWAKAPEKKPRCAGLGMVYALLSSAFFSVLALLVKKIEGVNALEISVIRCFFQMIFVLPAMIYQETGFLGPRGQRVFLILRGLLGSNAMILLYYAVQLMPLADAMVIVFSNPVITSLLAWMFLKEKCTVWDFLFTVSTLAGVVLIARPPFLFGSRVSGIEGEYGNHMKGTAAACGAAFCAACTMVVLRKMGKNVHYYLSVWYYAVMGLVESLVALLVMGEWTVPFCGRDRWFLMAIGVLGIAGQTFLTKALQLEKAGPVALMRTLEVVMAFMLQFLFLSQSPTWWSLGGALCIICSTSGVALRKWYNSGRRNGRQGNI